MQNRVDAAVDELVLCLPDVSTDGETMERLNQFVEVERQNYAKTNEAERLTTLAMVRDALSNCREQGDDGAKAIAAVSGALVAMGMSIELRPAQG